MITVRSLTYTYPGEMKPALSEVSLSAHPGECLCIMGRSGCGKTTLLWAMKGLLSDGSMAGDICFESSDQPNAANSGLGLVFQNAESQILCSTVAEEIAFGPENLCVPPEEIHERVAHALSDVGLSGFAARNVERLSAGQKHRLAIASVLSMHPQILLLDEPASQLDCAGKSELVETLKNLKAQGYTLIIAEHHLEPFEKLADRFVHMDCGRIIEISQGIPPEFAPPPTAAPGVSGRAPEKSNAAPAVCAQGLALAHPGVGNILSGFDLTVRQGECIHLKGRNGCGKSSLLAAMAGALHPAKGTIFINGQNSAGKKSLFGTVGYLMQNPQRQLFENTVFEEVAFSLKRLRLPATDIERRVFEALEICEADHLTDRLPLALSFGEQHRVALASVLAPRPSVLLLDEPFAGLDFHQRRRLLSILSRLREKYATTILMASHDDLPDRNWADRVIPVDRDAASS